MDIDLEVNVDELEVEGVSPNAGENKTNDGEVHGEDKAGVSSPKMDVVSTEGDVNFEPCKQMEFESKEVAYSFYKEYAKVVGFDTVIKNSRRSKCSGEFIDASFGCSRHGSKRMSSTDAKTRRPSVKTDCKASMNVRRRDDGKWFVHNFMKEHNHELSPARSHCCPSHSSINFIVKNHENSLGDDGEHTSKISVVMSEHQNVGCFERYIRNSIHKGRRLEDAQAMLEMFVQMKEKNPNFFYAIDVDDEQRLKNVFWVDAKGRNDYVHFGDIVFLDTTYLSNKFIIPLVPFIGVNHHFQPTLLGCALIVNETPLAFIWIMRTWLKAMGGVAPRSIITEQNKAIKTAVAEVFPYANHQFCSWHILREVPKKLGHVAGKHQNFLEEFNKCTYRSWTDEEFEIQWWNMVHTFELSENEWIRSLYEDRRQWVPTYTRGTFLSGMSTGQRSESIYSFLDNYIEKKTTLKEFIEKFEVIIQDVYDKESKADYDSWNELPALKTHSPYEIQMATVYTHEIFNLFQVEVLGTTSCRVKLEKEGGTTIIFRVEDFEVQQDFTVAWDETKSEVSCLCCLFEYQGFLCRHAMVVLRALTVPRIPMHYILKRWTKDAKCSDTLRQSSGKVQSRVQRHKDLCQQGLRLFEDGSLSQESYNIIVHALENARKQLNSRASSCDGHYGPQQSTQKLDYSNLGSTPLQEMTYDTFGCSN